MNDACSIQRIVRLTPLETILALIAARIDPVRPQSCALDAARGAVLAADVITPEIPPQPIGLRDGVAVHAATLADAGSYMPVALPSPLRRIAVGEPLPSGTDAILPIDGVMTRGDRAEAVAAVASGEGVLPAGGDAGPHVPLRRAGARVRGIDVAVMQAAAINELAIRRPRVSVVFGGATVTAPVEAALAMLARLAGASGAAVSGNAVSFETALADQSSDAVLGIGGTGSGRRDAAVQTLARLGQAEAHGIAISPGQTAAFGFVGKRPILLVPGRLDAALACWLLIGRHLLARLAGGSVADPSMMLPLKRKVASPIGLTELIPVDCAGAVAEPLASGYLSLSALARSCGYIVVPADSEGFAAGTPVAVRSWP